MLPPLGKVHKAYYFYNLLLAFIATIELEIETCGKHSNMRMPPNANIEYDLMRRKKKWLLELNYIIPKNKQYPHSHLQLHLFIYSLV